MDKDNAYIYIYYLYINQLFMGIQLKMENTV
jgi:hypothetical protein